MHSFDIIKCDFVCSTNLFFIDFQRRRLVDEENQKRSHYSYDNPAKDAVGDGVVVRSVKKANNQVLFLSIHGVCGALQTWSISMRTTTAAAKLLEIDVVHDDDTGEEGDDRHVVNKH